MNSVSKSNNSVNHKSDIAIIKFSLFKGVLFIATLGLIPAYVFPSGKYQIVDIPIVATILYVWSFDFKKLYFKSILYLLPFVIWAFLISMTYYGMSDNIYYLITYLPILYAPFILITFFTIFEDIIKGNKIYYIYLGLLLSLFVTFFVKGVPDEEDRAILSFNNPNQLGYFAIILMSYVILLLKYKAVHQVNNWFLFLFDAVIVLLAHFFLLLSVSRSAIIAVLLIDVYLLKYIKNNTIFFVMIGLLCISGFFIFLEPDFIQERLMIRASEAYTGRGMMASMEQRAIHPLRQLEGVQYLFGKGQGTGMESHSFLLEILRGYGLIGVALFLVWLIKAISMTRIITETYFIWGSLLLFNLGNYGLRWRGVWILLGFLFAFCHSASAQNNDQEKSG